MFVDRACSVERRRNWVSPELLLPNRLHCDSTAKDPAQDVSVDVPMDRSYALLWPLSAFSLASLTRNAPAEIGKLIPIQVVQLQQLNCELPVLSIRCDGLIRYLGLSKPAITIAGQLSPEGLLLAAERPSLPDARIE